MAKGEDMPKPWDRRPWPSAGERNLVKLHAAVGHALTVWEHYEAALAAVFCDFMCGDDRNILPAWRAYGAVRTFEGRCAMLRAAGEAYFAAHPDPVRQADLRSLLRDAKNFGERRNEITHAVVDEYKQTPAEFRIQSRGDGKIESWALLPSEASFTHREVLFEPKYCYVTDDIRHYTKCFNLMKRHALSFAGIFPKED